MPSIPYLLMREYDDMAHGERALGNYERAFVFGSAEGMVNNFLHGNTAAECLRLTKQTFLATVNDHHDMLTEDEAEAYADAVIVLDIFAEQYRLDIS